LERYFFHLFCLGIRNLRHLAPFSAFGIVSVAVAVSIVLYYGFSAGAHIPQMNPLPTDYFLFFGMAIFAFEGKINFDSI
jgi:hypothetical protein